MTGRGAQFTFGRLGLTQQRVERWVGGFDIRFLKHPSQRGTFRGVGYNGSLRALELPICHGYWQMYERTEMAVGLTRGRQGKYV